MGMEPIVSADANAFGPLVSSIPNPLLEYEKQQQFQAQLEGLKAEAQQRQAEAQKQQQEAARAQDFQRDLETISGDPSATNISHLIMKYPEFADKVKSGWDVKDKAVRDADLTQMSEIYSAAAGGNYPVAAKAMESRVQADKAAGHEDPTDQAILDALNSGDPVKQKGALGLIGTHLAAVTGAEHFGTVYGALKGGYTLEAGATRFDQNGNIEAQSPFIKGQDGTIYERDAAPGTTAPNPAAAPDTTPGGDSGFDHAVAFTLRHEGGYNPHDMNGAPVNFGINQSANPGVDVAHMTQDEAKDIYKTKYWEQSGAAKLPAAMQTPYFDTYVINPARAQQFLKASGGDPNKFMGLRETWLNSVAAKHPQYAKAYATRNADLRLTMAGTQDAQAASSSGAPAGFHTLVPGKPKDAPSGYRFKPDGSLEAIPGGPADKTGGVALAPGNTELSGPGYISDLHKTNPSLANQVQGVLDTRLAYPPATARTPQAQQLRAAVLQADPTYDEQAYKRRQTTIQQYTPGHTGPGQSMLSAATLINHMYDLAQAARELPDHTFALQNSLSALGARATNQQWLIKYNEGRKFVASELPKFLEGKAPTEGQVSQHYDSYDPSKGKSGIQAALSTDVDYLYGRYQPLLQAYKDNVGKELNLDKFAPGQVTAAKAAALEYYRANGALPMVVANPGQAAKLPHGALFATPDGRVLRRH